MTAKERKKIIWYLVLIIVISVAVSVWGSRIDAGPIVSWVQRTGAFAPIIYVLILATTSIIGPLNGTPILIAGYLVFGSWVQFYAYLGFLVSATVNFYIARRWGRAWVTKLVGKDDMDKVDSFTKDYGIISLIFLRLLQGPFSDYISYAYGFTNVKFTPYMIVNLITPIPWLLLWYLYIFPKVDSITDFSVWILITLVPVLIISWFYWKSKISKKK